MKLAPQNDIHAIDRCDYPIDQNVVSLFEARVRDTPDAIAIISSEGTATYAQLASRTDQICNYLLKNGIRPEQPIGVLLSRSIDMVATLLGIMKSGGAYVPLDPDDPVARNQRIIESSRCRLVLANDSFVSGMRSAIESNAEDQVPLFVNVANIDAAGLPTESLPTESLLTAPGGKRLAYMLFTSGSTGQPKGVMIEHRSVINLLCAARDFMQFNQADRFLAASTIGFDISVAELFLPLITGGSLLLRDRRILLDPRQLAQDVWQFQVTVMQTGPSVWGLILSELPEFPKLRVAISTAEPISPDLAEKLVSCGDQVWNLYGPTEATVWATAHRLASHAPTPDKTAGQPTQAVSAPIGRPIANTEVIIVDEYDQPVCDGQRGELCIGGIGVARGYSSQPDLTDEKFFHDGKLGQRFYKTGDLVAWSAGGELIYFGRNDDQMKIRGVRIDPSEVESAIRSHPAVRDTAATWFPTSSGTRSIVGAIVMNAGTTLKPDDLHRWLESHLNWQMIPSRFIEYETLPRSPSGKVDRRTIREDALKTLLPLGERGESRALTDTEKGLTDIWKRLLGLASVEVDDHFFSIGGDSLAAVRMLLDVEAAFQVALPVQVAFELPTLARLADAIDQERSQPGTRAGSSFIFPLTDRSNDDNSERNSEDRPWFFHTVDLGMAAKGKWNLPGTLFAIAHWAQGTGFNQSKSVSELARTHVAEIRAIQPNGPYRIAGYSFGGLVALETAHQLKSQGQQVELLFLLDPIQPRHTNRGPQRMFDHKPWSFRLEGLLKSNAEIPKKVINRIWTHPVNELIKPRLFYHIVHWHGRRPNPISTRLLPKNRWPAFWHSIRRLAKSYVAKPYDGPALAMFTDNDRRYRVWSEVLGSEERFHLLDAKHTNLFADPGLSEWMTILQSAVEEIDSQARPLDRGASCPDDKPVTCEKTQT